MTPRPQQAQVTYLSIAALVLAILFVSASIAGVLSVDVVRVQ